MEKIKALLLKYREIISYLIVGGLTTVVSLIIYYGLTLTVLDATNAFQLQAANVISWIGAVAFAYFTNRKFVFQSESRNMLAEAAAFVGSRLLSLLMDMGIMALTVTVMGMDDRIAKIISQVVVIVANYVLSKFIVFRKKKDPSAETTDKKEE